ncbi:MAG: hypothetical protein NVS4B5_05820 [Vulcanimicrobiaceae bacterium]
MFLRTLGLAAALAVLSPIAVLAQGTAPAPNTMASMEPGAMMASPMPGGMSKHHRHHRKHGKHCRDANGKFVKCTAPGAMPMSSGSMSSGSMSSGPMNSK